MFCKKNKPLVLVSAIHPLISPHIDAICHEIRSRIEGVRRIVLLGSATNGGNFDPDTSDVDIAVVMDEVPSGVWERMGEAGHEIYRVLPSVPQISILTTQQVDRWRNFELCYEGRVAAGIVLFSADSTCKDPTLSRDEAKAEVVAHYLGQAKRWLQLARSERKTTYIRFAEFESCRATCRALHALLANSDIDPSPKAIRWNLTELLKLVAVRYSVPAEVCSSVLSIPADIKGNCRWTLEWVEKPAADAVLRSRLAVARAWFVIRWCAQMLGEPND